MKYFKHKNAQSIKDVSEQLASEKACVIAGGSDLLGVLKERILPDYPETVINIKTIEGLDYITEDNGELRIGALTKLKDIADSDLLRMKYPAISEAAYSVASPLIRNQATIGGNLCQDVRCWYYRYPNQLGGRINCARKTGESCFAIVGESRYHSIFGGIKVHMSPCTEKCPANVDIPAYMARIRENDLDGAAEILLRNNPMPSITSRVCAHFCQEGCNRNEYDTRVGVGNVERIVGDHIMNHTDRFMTAPKFETGKTVGIIGSGPAGLSAAYYLRKSGNKVTVFDRMPEAGGLLNYALPSYRIPKEYVQDMIKALEKMGVVFKLNTQIGKDIMINDIVSEFDSTFVDTGAWKPVVLGINGEEFTRFGLEFLVEVKSWMKDKPGTDVIVVGGGNVAIDVVVTAKRLGAANVTMISLEGMNELPASKEEIERAKAEGIKFMPNWGPKRVLKENGKVVGIELKRCTSVRDDNGRFSPQYDENEIITISGDSILLAVGQQTDLSFLGEKTDLEINRGRILVDELTQLTSKDGIFAGGDITTGPSTVVKALAAGRRAADAMEKYLNNISAPARTPEAHHLLKFNPSCATHSDPVPTRIRPIEERGLDVEDDLGILPEDVITEANRCLNCGCLAVNPSDMATVLVCLKAKVNTNKRQLDAEQFFQRANCIKPLLEQDEIVTEIIVPAVGSSVTAYDKFRERKSYDFAIVGLASAYEMQGSLIKNASIVLGAVAPIPIRAITAEEYLKGKEINEVVAKRASELALQDANPLETNKYKVEITKELVRRSILKLKK